MYPVELHGERVRVREFEESDLDAIFEYARHEVAGLFMPWPAPTVPDDSKTFLSECLMAQRTEPRYKFEMALEIDGVVKGGVGIRVHPFHTVEAELGYILHPDLWGRGYVAEASRLMITFAFEQLNVHRVCAFYVKENVASGRVMDKLGMQQEGELREMTQDRSGAWRDAYLRSVLVSDWSA